MTDEQLDPEYEVRPQDVIVGKYYSLKGNDSAGWSLNVYSTRTDGSCTTYWHRPKLFDKLEDAMAIMVEELNGQQETDSEGVEPLGVQQEAQALTELPTMPSEPRRKRKASAQAREDETQEQG